MQRLWILGTANGKARVLLGSAAVREQRKLARDVSRAQHKLARDIDRTIGRALRGELPDAEIDDVERLALLADRMARSG